MRIDYPAPSHIPGLKALWKASFDDTDEELERFFTPHKQGAARAGVRIYQMHMPYPIFVPQGTDEANAYLWQQVAPKSVRICAFFGCAYDENFADRDGNYPVLNSAMVLVAPGRGYNCYCFEDGGASGDGGYDI